MTHDTDEEEAPTQASIAALTDYRQPWVSQVLSDLYVPSSELPRGRGGARLVRRLERPQRRLRPPHRQGFGVALNEATLVGVEVDPTRPAAALTFSVLSLPPAGAQPPADPRLSFVLEPLGRVAASLREGSWDDMKAQVEPFELDRLPEVVASFNQLPVYGWEFLDVPEADRFARIKRRLSLDWHSRASADTHTLDLFQEAGAMRNLELRFWFDDLRIYRPDGSEVSFDDFVAGGVRWWNALRAGDSRTEGHGIVPGAPSNE